MDGAGFKKTINSSDFFFKTQAKTPPSLHKVTTFAGGWNHLLKGKVQREKLENPWESTPDIYHHIPPRHVLDSGCIGNMGQFLGNNC